MELDHFILELVDYYNSGEVERLCVKVKGKSDKEWVTLLIWSDNENPEFCLVRHLLVYLKLTGITGGFLFPHGSIMKKIEERSADFDGNVLLKMLYQQYTFGFKMLF